MSDREPLAPDLKALEAALASLTPAPTSAAERDRLMFAAGRAATHRAPHWFRDVATYVGIFLALMLGRWSAQLGAPSPTLQIAAPIAIEPNHSTAAANLAAPSSYFQLRRHLDTLELAGVDSVPSTSGAAPPTSPQALMHELLN